MKQKLTESMSMDAIMRAWPATIRVALRHRMLCVGCSVAGFHTISDACREHGVDEDAFFIEIAAAIKTSSRKL